jgi:hypothetical protein
MGRPRKGEERHGTGALNIKGISPQARDAVLHSSRVRGVTMARYLQRLVGAHDPS